MKRFLSVLSAAALTMAFDGLFNGRDNYKVIDMLGGK